MKRFAILSGGALSAAICASLALAGQQGAPTSVSLSVSPGGASCTYNEVTTPKLKCRNLRGERIKSGTTITLVAKANAPMPAGWKLYIQRQGPLADNNAAHAVAIQRKGSYPTPHLCGPTRLATCTTKTTRKVASTSPTDPVDLLRAVVQKNDGTSFEAYIAIRWCGTSTPGCVG